LKKMPKCNLCASDKITELGNVGLKPASITSDSKLCGLAARIYICRNCSHLQKIGHSKKELAIINSVYSHYAPHHLSSGNEQLVFPEGMPPSPRTYYVIEKLKRYFPQKGRLLDIGTGNGAFLKSASELLPDWSFDAHDISAHFQKEVLSIPNVREFYTCDLSDLPEGEYDMVVLWHVLEHISEPADVIGKIAQRLNDDGLLLLQVPDLERNPFDLAVIDHSSHFIGRRLADFLGANGFELINDASALIHNCLTLLLRKGKKRIVKPDRSCATEKYFYWTKQAVSGFSSAVDKEDYAVFGTGMASLWISSQLPGKPLYYIDEDPAKVNQTIDDVRIVTPDKVSNTAVNVLMPFFPAAGMKITKKLKRAYPNLKGFKPVYPGQISELKNRRAETVS